MTAAADTVHETHACATAGYDSSLSRLTADADIHQAVEPQASGNMNNSSQLGQSRCRALAALQLSLAGLDTEEIGSANIALTTTYYHHNDPHCDWIHSTSSG